MHNLLLNLEMPERPIEAIAERGLSVLTDDQLADLAIRPSGLLCLADYLREMLSAERVGDVWWEEIDRLGQSLPKESPEVLAEVIRRLKAMDGCSELNAV